MAGRFLPIRPASAPADGDASFSQIARGIALMIGAFAVFSILDAVAKYASATLTPGAIVFARYFFALVFVLAFIAARGKWRSFETKHLPFQLLRGLLLAVSTGLNFVAVGYLQLAQTSSIMFSNPLWVCALSPVLLGEKVGIRRWSAVIIGFIGVLIIIRPGTGSFHWAMLLSLSMALLSALYQIATRRIGATDSVTTSMIYATLVGAVLAAPVAPVGWHGAPGSFLLVLLVIGGFCGAFGHMMLIEAHRLAPAPTLAPFIYSQIIWMTALGYFIFGDVPDLYTALGAVIVVASGLYVFWRERQLARRSL